MINHICISTTNIKSIREGEAPLAYIFSSKVFILNQNNVIFGMRFLMQALDQKRKGGRGMRQHRRNRGHQNIFLCEAL